MIYTYSVQLDVDDTRAYTNGLAELQNVMVLDWWAGMNQPYQNISNPAGMRITLANHDGRYSQDNSSAQYYSKLNPGRLIRVRMTYNGVTETMTELRITDVQETFGEFVTVPTIMITCSDKIKELLEYEYAPVLLQDARTDEGLTELHKTARVIYPNNRSYFFIDVDSIDGTKELYNLDDTDFEQGRTTIEFLGDHLGQGSQSSAQKLVRDLMKAEVFGLYFFQPRTGLYRFLNRLHAIQETSAAIFRTDDKYITTAQPVRGRNPYGMGPLNIMTIDYAARVQGAVGSVLYSSNAVPFYVQPNSTKKIRGRFFDPNADNARVGGIDVIPPQPQVDIIANNQEGGGGADRLADLNISHSIKASSIEFSINNPNTNRIWITTLQVRGTPLTLYSKETVEAKNVDSIYNYDAFEAHDSVILSDIDTIQSIADMLVNTFGTPRTTIEKVNITVSPDIAATVLTLTMGSMITLKNVNETHDKEYLIMGELHRANVAQGKHEVGYILRAKETTSLFMIDTSSIDGTDVIDI